MENISAVMVRGGEVINGDKCVRQYLLILLENYLDVKVTPGLQSLNVDISIYQLRGITTRIPWRIDSDLHQLSLQIFYKGNHLSHV